MTDYRKFPLQPMAYADAIKYTEEWIYEHLLADEERTAGFMVVIYDYLDNDPAGLVNRPFCGIRVAELSIHTATRGGSYMQVDAPWGIAVCGQVERCILALIEGWNQESHADSQGDVYGETDDEFWRLSNLWEMQMDKGKAEV